MVTLRAIVIIRRPGGLRPTGQSQTALPARFIGGFGDCPRNSTERTAPDLRGYMSMSILRPR
eukprot:10537785-Alexandrium_andersonii.AAC.1